MLGPGKKNILLRLRSNMGPGAGIICLLTMGFLILLGPLIAPHDPYQTNLDDRLKKPSLKYPLGTDAMGRCLLSRLIYGCRVTPVAGFIVVVFAAVIGTAIGLAAGYFGGWFDYLISGLIEGALIFPAIGVVLVMAAFIGPNMVTLTLALAAVHWVEYARITRNLTLKIKAEDYILAAKALGAGSARIIFIHILPQVWGLIIVLAAFSMAWAILSFAGLSFLGLGASPGTPEWGLMVSESRFYLRTEPRLVTIPGLVIMATVFSVNLLGDFLRDRFGTNQSI